MESDRAVVERNVASLMRDLKLVPLDSTHEEALQVFDHMVQSTLPRAMRSSIGRAGFRYELVVVVVFCVSLFKAFDVVAAQVFAGASSQAVVAHRARKNHLGLCPHASWCCVSLGAEWSMHAPQWWEQGPLRAVAFWIVDGVGHLGERSA